MMANKPCKQALHLFWINDLVITITIKSGYTGIVYVVIQAHSYQLFDFVQSVYYIMPASNKMMSYAHKLCIQTGATVSFKPEDLTTSCLLSLSYSIWQNNFTAAVVQHHI